MKLINRIYSTINEEIFFKMIPFNLKQFIEHDLIVLYPQEKLEHAYKEKLHCKKNHSEI